MVGSGNKDWEDDQRQAELPRIFLRLHVDVDPKIRTRWFFTYAGVVTLTTV